MLENLSSAAVVIGALRVKSTHKPNFLIVDLPYSNFESTFCYLANSGYHYQSVFVGAWSGFGLPCLSMPDL